MENSKETVDSLMSEILNEADAFAEASKVSAEEASKAYNTLLNKMSEVKSKLRLKGETKAKGKKVATAPPAPPATADAIDWSQFI